LSGTHYGLPPDEVSALFDSEGIIPLHPPLRKGKILSLPFLKGGQEGLIFESIKKINQRSSWIFRRFGYETN